MNIFDNSANRLFDDLVVEIKKGSILSIASASFSIYSFHELKKQLESIDELRFIFTSPVFVRDSIQKEKREFYIPKLERERNLYGTPFELRLRNGLTQKVVAKECAEWVKNKVRFKSNISNKQITNFMVITNDSLDLLYYMKTHNDIEHAPYGMHAVVQASEEFKKGAIYILKNRVNEINIHGRNRLHPFYMIYILEDGLLLYNHLQPKELLDVVRYICKGKDIDRQACNIFNTDTADGKNMAKYSSLLTSSIESMVMVQEESNVENFLKGKPVSFIKDNISGIDDFELICFIAVV